MFCFSDNLMCFVFFNTRFEIRPFTLLPTKVILITIAEIDEILKTD